MPSPFDTAARFLAATLLAAALPAVAAEKSAAPGAKLPAIGAGGTAPVITATTRKIPEPPKPSPRINEAVLIAPYYTGSGDSSDSSAADQSGGAVVEKPAKQAPKSPARKPQSNGEGSAASGKDTESPKGRANVIARPRAPGSLRIEPAPAIVLSSRPAVSPNPAIAGRPAALRNLEGLDDRMQAVKAKQQVDAAGLGPALDRQASLTNPATGEPVELGRRSLLSGQPDLPGRDGAANRLGRGSSATDPLTGKPLIGGSGASDGPSGPDARAAGRAGKGMAMDGDTTDESTPVFQALTFDEAYLIAAGQTGGVEFERASGGGTVTIHSRDHSYADGTQRAVYVDHGDYTYVFVEGEEPERVDNDPSDRPRPDDDGSGNRRSMTADEKKAMEEVIRNSGSIAARPAPESGGAGGGKVGSDPLTDLDLAGRLRDDAQSGGGGGVPGAITTDLGLAGRPVDADPAFGTIDPGRVGGAGGGFGSAVRSAGLGAAALPEAPRAQAPAAERIGSRVPDPD